MKRGRARARVGAILMALGLTGGCDAPAKPPRNLLIDGLPVTGSLAFAHQSGFRQCLDFNNALRCRRDGIFLLGAGPYSGAVDSGGSDGGEGLRQLILWSDRDQDAVLSIGAKLAERGWALCRTGTQDRGDQDIYTRAGSRARVSIDISYWGKRRLRLLPEDGRSTGRCW
jgi:hypothetical protein